MDQMPIFEAGGYGLNKIENGNFSSLWTTLYSQGMTERACVWFWCALGKSLNPRVLQSTQM